MKELTEEENTYTGEIGGTNQWDYYYYQPTEPPMGGYQPFQVVLTLLNNNNDNNENDNIAHILYESGGAIPTQSIYDSRNGVPVDNKIPITVQSPSFPLYYFAVYTTATSLSYSISLSPCSFFYYFLLFIIIIY